MIVGLQELKFWERAVMAALTSGRLTVDESVAVADAAVGYRRKRLADLHQELRASQKPTGQRTSEGIEFGDLSGPSFPVPK
jgi:hypothetical protein